ncbi:MAG: hypothetical protein OIF50_00310 [Flavobacteriaceae bacterium]|nr:hypothetical protein [Flavobacteriaceae bacterium]
MKRQLTSLLIALVLCGSLLAQEQDPQTYQRRTNKGKVFVLWGYNRSWYAASDIHFKGQNYDFTLHRVTAKDRQTPFTFKDYFSIDVITAPQTNFRIGYFINDKYSLSIGVDHMKYVMVQDQRSAISGGIHTGGNWDGNYDNDPILLTEDFLQFEHTDGLNYVLVELTRNDDLFALFPFRRIPNIDVFLQTGVGLGLLYPKSNVTLMNFDRYDEFHTAGWGANIKVGLNISFWKYFFLQSEFKSGYIRMNDILTTPDIATDKAAQGFLFSEWTYTFGVNFWLF